MVASVGRITAGRGYDYLTREVATSRHDYYTGSGEAPGMWTGSGRIELELDGVVDADDMAALYGSFLDPRTTHHVQPTDGRVVAPTLVGEALRSEPKVLNRGTANERVLEQVAAFDVTFSPSKSVTVLWATACDRRVRATVVAAHEVAVSAGLAYLEANAGHTRVGRNGVRRMVTSGFVIAQFRHRSARSTRPGERVGDPQLHSHCAILNRVRGVDGRWRTLDGEAIYRHAHAAGALYAAVLERELSDRLAVSWAAPDGRVPMREIVSVPGEVIARFSSRREQVLDHFERLLVEWTAVHGRSPTRAERAGILDEATVRSRSAKRKGNETDLHDHWRAQLTPCEQTAIDTVTGCQLATNGGRMPAGSTQLAEAVMQSLHEQRSWWTRAHVFGEVARLVQDPTVEAIELEVERIIGGCLELEPDRDHEYAQHDKTKFTSTTIKEAEQRVLNAAVQTAPWTVDPLAMVGLGDDQTDAVTAICAGEYQVSTVIGPAGAGKTTMLKAAAESYGVAERPVAVLTLSAAAARVVTEETGLPASTIAAWRVGQVRLPRNGLVIVDEASMVPTLTLDQLIRVAAAYHCRIAMVGDYAQMGAPEAGGLLRDLAGLPSATHMASVRRFHQPWERDASKQLRRRNRDIADVYDQHDRLIGVTTQYAVTTIADAWLNDILAGYDSIIVVDTTAEAALVSARCQQLLAGNSLLGETAGAGVDQTWICVGDLVQTRLNTNTIATSDGSRVLNRDVWRITGSNAAGDLLATHTRTAVTAEIPAGYAHDHVVLAYATTIAGAQGRTLDTGHVLVTPRTAAGALYVGMTRGREANHAYVITDSHDHEEFQLGDLSPRDAFAAAVSRAPEGQLSAAAIEQRWKQTAGQRLASRTDDRTHQRAFEWWTQRQTALPPQIADALHGHHQQVIAVLASRGPATWATMIRSATTNTSWDQHRAVRTFIERLETMPSSAAGGASSEAPSTQAGSNPEVARR
jgi:conjugative relaxase-like TrwC/TraI family protein